MRSPYIVLALAFATVAGSFVLAEDPLPVAPGATATRGELPPGWLPVQRLDDAPTWKEFRAIDDRIHLYLPPGEQTVRGVFACYVFHSADPRPLCRAWRFALVTVPWPFEYDLGVNDKRNGRFKLGHPAGDMSVLLRYLEAAAKETKHPELAVAPLVGWLGQNGGALGADLLRRAPDRVIAWSDSFPIRLDQQPELTAQVPFPYAWEFGKKDETEQAALRETKEKEVAGKPTVPVDLKCRANTYDFPHGIYSKWNFFAGYLDRCIRLRLPEETPPPGTKTVLRPVVREQGWVGDYNPVGEWNPIAPFAEARGMIEPVWLPDAYAASMWRAYHSRRPDLELTAPVVAYHNKKGSDRSECGLGYGPSAKAGAPLRFAAATTGTYAAVEFFDGDRSLGSCAKPPYELPDVKLERGLHALHVVGTRPDGSRSTSRAAFLVVE